MRDLTARIESLEAAATTPVATSDGRARRVVGSEAAAEG